MTGFDDALLAVGAIFAALIVIFGGLLRLFRIAQRIDSAIGVDEKGRTISQRLTSVENAVMPDGQTSLPSRVDQIEKDLVKVDTKVDALATEVHVIHKLVVKEEK